MEKVNGISKKANLLANLNQVILKMVKFFIQMEAIIKDK